MRTTQTIADDFWQHVDKNGPVHPVYGQCWVWKRYRLHGYGRLRYHGKLTYAHRVAWLKTHGRLAHDKDVLHKCDNPPCCRPDHLFLGTDETNSWDCTTKGRRPAKLNAVQVRLIRKLWASTPKAYGSGRYLKLASQFGVTPGTIHNVVRGTIWKHVT